MNKNIINTNNLEHNSFEQLNLTPSLLLAINDLGYSQPTKVQTQTIGLAIPTQPGRYQDLMVSSKTGSGKTAAFLLPVLNALVTQYQASKNQQQQEFEQKVAQAIANGQTPPKKPKRKNPKNIRQASATKPKALVLCPTRELAQQVNQDAIALLKYSSNVRVASVIGGTPYYKQVSVLQGASLVIATPGRLLDLQSSGQIQLDEVQFLILDEADRMLDLGFSEDLTKIEKLCKNRLQTLMFSATFAPNIQKLAAGLMDNPIKIEVSSHQEKHADISQKLMWADNQGHKRQLLDTWLRNPAIEQAIVFASTKTECDNLARDLQAEGFSAQALHGDLNQGLRNRRLNALRKGRIQILIATDVAARGIDIPTISHVFNYGLPMRAEDYTHRIGRTGRAGRSGTAITFAEFRDRFRIFDIERYTNQVLESMITEGLEPKQRFPKDGESLKSKSFTNSNKKNSKSNLRNTSSGTRKSFSRKNEQYSFTEESRSHRNQTSSKRNKVNFNGNKMHDNEQKVNKTRFSTDKKIAVNNRRVNVKNLSKNRTQFKAANY